MVRTVAIGMDGSTPAISRRTAPPTVGELPASLELGNQLYLPREGLPPALVTRLIRLAAFRGRENSLGSFDQRQSFLLVSVQDVVAQSILDPV